MTAPGARLPASLIDAHGHRITAAVTRSGLLAVITTAAPSDGTASGHPCLNEEQAAQLRDWLNEFIGGQGP